MHHISGVCGCAREYHLGLSLIHPRCVKLLFVLLFNTSLGTIPVNPVRKDFNCYIVLCKLFLNAIFHPFPVRMVSVLEMNTWDYPWGLSSFQ